MGVKSNDDNTTDAITPVHAYYPFIGAVVAGATKLIPDILVSS